MNIIAIQPNKQTVMTQMVSHPVKAVNVPEKPDVNSKDKKDYSARNKTAIGISGAVIIGGIAYFVLIKRKSVSVMPKTHIERLNAFGEKIIEDLKFSSDGKLIEKVITADETEHVAKYKDGKLISVDEYFPLSTDILAQEKYATLRTIMDETKTKLAILQDFGDSKNYYLLDKKGENVTAVNEFDADPDVMYQYLNLKLSPDKTKVYEISDCYSPKGNAAFAEIFENFKQ